jgi:NitT/TauT family transport system substrate-binding protein
MESTDMWLLRLNARQQLGVCLAAVLATAGVAGCTTGTSDAGSARNPDKVTYLTAFSVFGRETYMFTAKEKGFFAKRGIDVDIQAGNDASENLRILASGRAQFSANDLSGVMILQGQGKYTDEVRAVAAIQQHTLNSIMVPASSTINRPRDLEGRTLAGAPGATPQLLFPAYAKLAGFDPGKVRWVNAAPAQTLAVLASHQADGIGQFTVAVGTVTNAAGPVRVLP